MTTILPTLELKYSKETTSSSTNTITINNNIIIKPTRHSPNQPEAANDSLDVEVPNIELQDPSTLTVKNQIHLKILVNLKKLSSLFLYHISKIMLCYLIT
jgi:hypothetical protein